eukprot:2329484-Amphidinium_carterae.2
MGAVSLALVSLALWGRVCLCHAQADSSDQPYYYYFYSGSPYMYYYDVPLSVRSASEQPTSSPSRCASSWYSWLDPSQLDFGNILRAISALWTTEWWTSSPMSSDEDTWLEWLEQSYIPDIDITSFTSAMYTALSWMSSWIVEQQDQATPVQVDHSVNISYAYSYIYDYYQYYYIVKEYYQSGAQYGEKCGQSVPFQSAESTLWRRVSQGVLLVAITMVSRRNLFVGLGRVFLARRAIFATLRYCLAVVFRDIIGIYVIVMKAVVDVLFILIQWVRCCRRPLRKKLMQLRTVLLPAQRHEDDDLLEQVARAGAEYRPLRRIQDQQGRLHYAHLGRARWGGRRRWRCLPLGRQRILHNPGQHGQCLFDCVRFLASLHGLPRMSLCSLRTLAALELTKAWKNGEQLAGVTVEQWARQANKSVAELLDTRSRWGSTLDLYILTRSLNLPVRAMDLVTHQCILEAGNQAELRAVIGWRQRHFFVIRKPLHMSRRVHPTTRQERIHFGGTRAGLSLTPFSRKVGADFNECIGYSLSSLPRMNGKCSTVGYSLSSTLRGGEVYNDYAGYSLSSTPPCTGTYEDYNEFVGFGNLNVFVGHSLGSLSTWRSHSNALVHRLPSPSCPWRSRSEFVVWPEYICGGAGKNAKEKASAPPATKSSRSAVTPAPVVPPAEEVGPNTQPTPARKRPNPFGPLFLHVMAYPPPNLGRLIEVTAHYVSRSPRAEFERRLHAKAVADQNEETYQFLKDTHQFHAYYEACLQFYKHMAEQDTVDLTGSEQTHPKASVGGSSSSTSAAAAALFPAGEAIRAATSKARSQPQPPPPQKAKMGAKHGSAASLSPYTAKIQAAVIAVNKRRQAIDYVPPMGPPPAPPRGIATATTTEVPKRAAKAIERPPLPRRKRIRDGAEPVTILDDDTQLVEQVPYRPMPKPRIVLVERAEVLATTQHEAIDEPYVNPWQQSEAALRGVFKIAAPRVTPLSQFARATIAPLASLLQVRICLVSRRSQDQQVRVYYQRDEEDKLPVIAVSVEGFVELREACNHFGAVCPFLYLEAKITAPDIEYICNHWVTGSRTCQDAMIAVVRGAMWYLWANATNICPAAAIILHEAHHLVVLARPLTNEPYRVCMQEAQRWVTEYLARNAVRAEGREWPLVAEFLFRDGGSIHRPGSLMVLALNNCGGYFDRIGDSLWALFMPGWSLSSSSSTEKGSVEFFGYSLSSSLRAFEGNGALIDCCPPPSSFTMLTLSSTSGMDFHDSSEYSLLPSVSYSGIVGYSLLTLMPWSQDLSMTVEDCNECVGESLSSSLSKEDVYTEFIGYSLSSSLNTSDGNGDFTTSTLRSTGANVSVYALWTSVRRIGIVSDSLVTVETWGQDNLAGYSLSTSTSAAAASKMDGLVGYSLSPWSSVLAALVAVVVATSHQHCFSSVSSNAPSVLQNLLRIGDHKRTAPVFVQGGAWPQRDQPQNRDQYPTYHVCLLTGVRLRVGNEDRLRALIERYDDELIASPRPAPLDMYRHDPPEVRAMAEVDFRRLRQRVMRARPDHDVWLQYRFTPPARPLFQRFGGACTRTPLRRIMWDDYHIHALATALHALDYTALSVQELVLRLEKAIRDKAAVPNLLFRLLQVVDQNLGSWQQLPPIRRDFIRGDLLDLAILVDLYEVGINVIDEHAVNRLFIPGRTMVCLRLDSQALVFSALAVATDANRLLAGRDLDPFRPRDTTPIVWCSATHSQVAELLYDNPPSTNRDDVVASSPTASMSSSHGSMISSTVLWGSPGATQDSTMSSQCLASSLLLHIGAGGKRRPPVHLSSSSSPERPISVHSSQHTVGELSEDTRPLTALLAEQQDSVRATSPAPSLEHSDDEPKGLANSILFSGKFTNGRTQYSQVLWPGYTWKTAHQELNRAVRRRLNLWCMALNGVPVDPEAPLPIATSPHECIKGELLKLSAPLDYDDLRARGLLPCSP